ncbi:hypothetical protein ACWGCW_01025 [Streptomyces sp. NPDC054933]
MPVENTSSIPVIGPGTPYITPATLTAAPTGISWGSIPNPKATVDQQYAEQLNICGRATAMVNGYCNVPLRATIDTEMVTGPGDFRFQLQPTGRARLLLSRPPVVQVISGQWTPATAFPAQWTAIAASQFRIEKPLMGVYGTSTPGGSGEGGQAVLLAPGVVNWAFGRQSCDVEVTYLNGWPHASLTAAATKGAQTLTIDDVTGWTGAAGTMHDAAGQEAISVTAVTPSTTGALSGPGTLTLAAPLNYAHQPGVLVTTLPGTVIQATIMFATSQALIRGATATTVQALPGSRSSSGTRGPDDLIAEARQMLQPYRRAV